MGQVKVRVKEGEMGYYADIRRKEGMEFFISDKKHKTGPKAGKLVEFSERWMELVRGKASDEEEADGAETENPSNSEDKNKSPL